MAGRRHHPSRQHTVIDLKAVHVVVFRLLDEGQQGRERRGLGLLLAGNHPYMIAIPNKAIDFPQAGVMREPLERSIREGRRIRIGLGKRARQSGQLMVHQLIEQGVRLGRHTHRDAVLSGRQRRRHQIGHRFAHACAGFHHKVLGACERSAHGLGHGALLLTRLEVFVQRSHQPIGRERLVDFLSCGKHQRTQRIGGDVVSVDLRRSLHLAETLAPKAPQRERAVAFGRFKCFT